MLELSYDCFQIFLLVHVLEYRVIADHAQMFDIKTTNLAKALGNHEKNVPDKHSVGIVDNGEAKHIEATKI